MVELQAQVIHGSAAELRVVQPDFLPVAAEVVVDIGMERRRRHNAVVDKLPDGHNAVEHIGEAVFEIDVKAPVKILYNVVVARLRSESARDFVRVFHYLQIRRRPLLAV